MADPLSKGATGPSGETQFEIPGGLDRSTTASMEGVLKNCTANYTLDDPQEEDVKVLAKSYLMYQIGKLYF